MFESLTTISQYCLLDSNQQDIAVGPGIPTNPQNLVNDTATSSKIVYNLIHVFNPYNAGRVSTEFHQTHFYYISIRKYQITIVNYGKT